MVMFIRTIKECFHRHAIKIEIKNHSVDEVTKDE